MLRIYIHMMGKLTKKLKLSHFNECTMSLDVEHENSVGEKKQLNFVQTLIIRN